MILLIQLIIGLVMMGLLIKYLIVHPSAILSVIGKATKAANRRNVLFLTAHPDDECMFFAPSILKFNRHCNVHLLCISSGNFDQQGDVRSKELFASTAVLGLPKDRVFLLNDDRFKDGPNEDWDKMALASVIEHHVKKLAVHSIITFDEFGVSGHPNHKALCTAVEYYLSHRQPSTGVRAYKLVSTSLLRKYISVFDVAYSCMTSHIYLVSGWTNIRRAQRAMMRHSSQFVWFRWLYVLFSRYMLINTLEPFDETTPAEQTLNCHS